MRTETTAQTVERLAREVEFYERGILDLTYYSLNDKYMIPINDNKLLSQLFDTIEILHKKNK